MKTKMALLIAGLFLSFSVFAQQSIQGYKVVCSSNSYSADSVEKAVQACTDYGSRSRGNCNRGVSCRTYLTHCTARGYAGDTVEAAISACMEYGRTSQRNCARSVSCR